MKTCNKYVVSGIRKSISSNLKTIAFFIPFLILILSFVLSAVLPTYNHYNFVKNGNHNFVYHINHISYEELGMSDEIKAFYYNLNLFSHNDPKLNQSRYEIYYKYRPMVNLYICRDNIDTNKTMFSDNNILKSRHIDGPNIWISFDLAKALHVDIGDEVYLRFNYGGDFTDMPIKVSGITKTKYNDENPTKNNRFVGVGMLFLDTETFDWVVNKTEEGLGCPRVVFSDEEIKELNKYLFISKEEQMDLIRHYLYEYKNRILVVIVCGIILVYFLLSLDLSFTLKRHKRNMTILNMLGVPIHDIRSILVKMTLLNFTIAAIIAIILVKFLFLQTLLSIYVELEPLLITFTILMIVAFISSIFQSFRIKQL